VSAGMSESRREGGIIGS